MNNSQTDQPFVKQAKAGDVRGFARLHDLYYQPVFTFVYYRVDERQAAEDITSEVFVAMVKRIDQYKDKKGTMLPWLYTIARNLVIDHYRKNGSAPEVVPIEDMEIAAVERSPESVVSQQVETDCLEKAIRQLTDEQQEIIVGKFIEDRSNDEMAQLTHRSEGAVKSLQHRALVSLRRELEKADCYEPQI
jgi:RNA polymerase sigma-70 factor (ECF subfamily)